MAWLHALFNQAEAQLGGLALISDSKLPFPIISPGTVRPRARISFNR